MLTGAGGNDKFVFDSLIGLDTITDFISGQDKLEFASFTFTSLTPVGGPLDIGEFASTLAADADDFIIYNAATGAYGDMLDMGILDPTKVTRLALQNAASVAGLLLTTEVMIAEAPKDDDHKHGGMPDMSGMGDMGM